MHFYCKMFIYQLICNNFININGSLWSKYFCFVLKMSVIFYRKINIFIEISFISYNVRTEILEFSTIAIFHSNAFSFLHSYFLYWCVYAIFMLCHRYLSRNTHASMCNMVLSKLHDLCIRVGVNDENMVRERKPIILCLDMISKK